MITKRVVFDIDTEFTPALEDAVSIEERTRLAPRMTVACAFEEHSETYRFFAPDEAGALIELLESADEVISFNGNRFDLLVLCRHYGFKGRVRKHIDLCEIASGMAGFDVGLDTLARLNLGEGKREKMEIMDPLPCDLPPGFVLYKVIAQSAEGKLKAGCKSDVRLTYELFRLYQSGTLMVPPKTSGARREDEENGCAPQNCPSCHAPRSMTGLDWDNDEMSEGQLADYSAGMYGSALCRACGEVIDWGF